MKWEVPKLTYEEAQEILLAYCRGEVRGHVLRDDSLDSTVVRLMLGSGTTKILKLWRKPGIRGALRRISRTGPMSRELTGLRSFRESGLNVPSVLGYCNIRWSGVPYTSALFLEDLGTCLSGYEYIRRLIREGQYGAVSAFEDEMIGLTAGILDAGLVDWDHSMSNIVVSADNKVFRVDCEMVVRMFSSSLARTLCGKMLGWFLTSYTFAVQPDVARTYAFAKRLMSELKLSECVLKRAGRYVDESMQQQYYHTGIDTRVELPW